MDDFPLWKYGQGEITLVLVHGGPSLSRYMDTLGEVLKDRYSIIEYQQYGTPEFPSDDFTLKSLLHQLKIVLSHAPKNRILVGHSWGATLVNLYLQENKENAIFVDPAPLTQEDADTFGKNLRSRMNSQLLEKLDQIKIDFDQTSDQDKIQSLMQLRLDLISPFYHHDPSSNQKLGELAWNYHSFSKIMDEAWNLIDHGKLKELDEIPKLHGIHDPIPAQKNTFSIPDAGHFPWLEARNEFTQGFAGAVKRLRS